MSIPLPPAITLAGGSLIIACFLVAGFLAFVFAWYTRRGSAINQHPYADLDHASGPESPSELAHDMTQDVRRWDRGVGTRHRRRDSIPQNPQTDDEMRAALHAWRDSSGHGTLAALDRSTPVRGPKTGDELIVFWDYLAPGTATLAAALSELRLSRPVREAALHLPLADARPLSLLAAVAVEAARDQGQFWAAHGWFLERPPRDARAILAAEVLVDDPERFRDAVEHQTCRNRVLAHIRLAAESGVHAVPTVFIGGTRYDGEHDVRGLAAAIEHPAARHWDRRLAELDPEG